MSRREEIDNIVKMVEGWSPEEREELVGQLRKQASPLPPPPRATFERALGLGRGSGPAPTDEQVDQWIDEHRMRKYGS